MVSESCIYLYLYGLAGDIRCQVCFPVVLPSLGSRVRHLVIYWRVVTVVNVIAFVVCILTGFIECSYTSLRTCKLVRALEEDRIELTLLQVTCGQSRGLRKSSALTGVAIGLDVLTDFLSPNPLLINISHR